jgi:hypothetical protein
MASNPLFFNMIQKLFVLAPALMGNAVFFNAVIQSAGGQP